ncbi:hypothetical protein TZ03_18685 [Pseudomonas sp. 10-1B]|uniref:hypothetical protein n=1 Tax=Pseudomonas sp. 10-1B TaxID=1546029 RepID=UPI00061FF9E2|nr:hypothetical protein [Pseudomonas sp. 10-1B]KIY39135.1 hypothetical protein TZ03_18685 [Pseudomonas sp. 10-1B]
MTKKQTNKLSMTIVHGTPPAWDAAEFNRRLLMRLNVYENTSECTEIITHPLEHEFLQLVGDKLTNGYSLDRRWAVHHAQLSHRVQMVKPASVQSAEKESLKAVVKSEYVQYLQTQLNEYKEKLTQQLIEAAEEKERRALEQAKAKRFADAEKEANTCFGELSIPDGFPDEVPDVFTTDM